MDTVMHQTHRWLNRLGIILFFIAFFNFAVFWIVAVCIGGDAISGKVENGRYYVANHGRYTEVSREVWTYSKFHSSSVWITHPIGILGGAGLITYAQYRKKKRQNVV
jgi:hypothetical protein